MASVFWQEVWRSIVHLYVQSMVCSAHCITMAVDHGADRPIASVALHTFFYRVLFVCYLSVALGMQLWMNEASSHHSTSAACEYLMFF